MLNKCDLVEEDWLELVKEEIKEELEGTFLEQAPIVEVSAATGQGIPELIEVIERLTAEEVVEKDVNTIPRCIQPVRIWNDHYRDIACGNDFKRG